MSETVEWHTYLRALRSPPSFVDPTSLDSIVTLRPNRKRPNETRPKHTGIQIIRRNPGPPAPSDRRLSTTSITFLTFA